MERKELIRERIVAFFKNYEKRAEIQKELDRLGDESAKLQSLLYTDRPKDYIKDVLHVLAGMKDEYSMHENLRLLNAYADLCFFVQESYDSYTDYIFERLERMSEGERAIFEGEVD